MPAGTTLIIALEGTVSSATSRVDELIRGTLADDVVIDGVTAIAAGAPVEGLVTKAVPSGDVKGRGELVLRFTSLRVRGGVKPIAVPYARSARSGKKKDAKTIAGPNVTLPAGTKLHLTLDRDIKVAR